MEAYYGYDTIRNKEVFYVPGIVVGIRGDPGGVAFNWDWDIMTLRGIEILLKKGYLNVDRLMRLGWEFERVQVNDGLVRKFVDDCFKDVDRDKIIERAYELLDSPRTISDSSPCFE